MVSFRPASGGLTRGEALFTKWAWRSSVIFARPHQHRELNRLLGSLSSHTRVCLLLVSLVRGAGQPVFIHGGAFRVLGIIVPSPVVVLGEGVCRS